MRVSKKAFTNAQILYAVLAVVLMVVLFFLIRDYILKPGKSLSGCSQGDNFCVSKSVECSALSTKDITYHYMFTKPCKTSSVEDGRCCEPIYLKS